MELHWEHYARRFFPSRSDLSYVRSISHIMVTLRKLWCCQTSRYKKYTCYMAGMLVVVSWLQLPSCLCSTPPPTGSTGKAELVMEFLIRWGGVIEGSHHCPLHVFHSGVASQGHFMIVSESLNLSPGCSHTFLCSFLFFHKAKGLIPFSFAHGSHKSHLLTIWCICAED